MAAPAATPVLVTGPAITLTSEPTSAPTSAPASSITTAATAATPASRVPVAPAGTCEQIAVALASRHTDLTQVVEVRTTSWTDTTAVLQLADRSGTGWRCGPAMVARVGRAGLRPLAERRSGDDTTPAGVFPLGVMTAPDGRTFSFFGNQPDPGVAAGGYHASQPGDCFGATPGTARYGHLVTASRCDAPDERIAATGPYTTVALIGANTEPDVSGDAPGEIPYAAAIFLHRFTYATAGATSGATKATSGCVSLAQADLTTILLQLRSDVRFAIGTTDWLLGSA